MRPGTANEPIHNTASQAAPTRSSKAAAEAAAQATAAIGKPMGGGGKKKRRGIQFGKVINNKGLTIFTRQLATLVKAGMPIMRALEVLARQEKNLAFKEILENIGETIRAGGNFSDGLAHHSRVFDRLYINMVKAGEVGGVLDVVLERLAKFQEKAEHIRGKVKAAMTYPIVIVVVACSIVGALMVFVVPKFEQLFREQLKGQPLPFLTQLVLNIANFIKENVLLALGIGIAVYFGLKLIRRTRAGTKAVDWLLIRGPIVGDLFLKAAIARFTRTFGTLMASGVPILNALMITRDTSGNMLVSDAITVVHDRVKEGDPVAKPLEATAIFPGMVTSMIEVGEETGALPDMLTRIADIYEEEVDNAVDSLTALIEPLMIVMMAVMVGTIVLALFLPIVRIIELMSG